MSDQPETISLIHPILGMTPYTLIEMREASDGSGEPALFVEAGGGAEEEPLYMPLLAISEAAPEGNPIAEMLRRLAGAESDGYYDQAIAAVTREFNTDWLPFVFPEQ